MKNFPYGKFFYFEIKIMTETEYLEFCKNQITGPLKEEDIITMLTAWGAINYSLGYKNALVDNDIEVKE
ncbi:hypothetical protein [Pedobacter foliorum]|uniref:hypothetical protein n=1 Tax=Pedobacter foliorum TaxID=2739058 RepID=UPI00156340F4|nr:hypothetical protein [Pedobacter foliorum]NRF40875.1 hypothetical protein [Pedobacter foliorum]